MDAYADRCDPVFTGVAPRPYYISERECNNSRRRHDGRKKRTELRLRLGGARGGGNGEEGRTRITSNVVSVIISIG